MNTDQTPVLFLQRFRVEKMIRQGAALLTVDTSLCDLPPGLPRVCGLRVGYGLTPSMPDLELRDDALTVTMAFGTRSHFVRIPWAAVHRSELETPPSGPNGGHRKAA